MIGKLTQNDINKVTLYAYNDGLLIGCLIEPKNHNDLINVGKVEPAFSNLISNAARLHTMLTACISGNEMILTMLENEGLDKAAGHLTELIAAMKLVQKCSIDGPDVLTAQNATAK